MSDHSIFFEAIAMENQETAYASAYELNGLFRVNLKTGECEYITLFPREEITRSRLHSAAVLIGKKVYFIPSFAKYISVYDLSEGSFSQISVPKSNKEYDFYKGKFKFVDAKLYGDNLWLFPSAYLGIVKLNIKTNEISVLDQWIPPEGYFFRRALCVNGNMAYIPDGVSNYVLELNMENEKTELLQIGNNNHGMMSMKLWKGQYWMAPRLSGAVICWNPDTNFIKEMNEYPEEFATDRIVFSAVIACNDHLYLMPASANFVIDIGDDGLLIYDKWKPDEGSMGEVLFETDDYYYFREVLKDGISSKHYKIIKENGEIVEYRMIVQNDLVYKADILKAASLQGEVIKESRNFSLNDFLKLI